MVNTQLAVVTVVIVAEVVGATKFNIKNIVPFADIIFVGLKCSFSAAAF